MPFVLFKELHEQSIINVYRLEKCQKRSNCSFLRMESFKNIVLLQITHLFGIFSNKMWENKGMAKEKLEKKCSERVIYS
ncbi:hypothetical protein AXI59_10040 [Bacillus nakamurai]|nr:hypothetical protein AXI59_10040 [Bacillus nakamurai]